MTIHFPETLDNQLLAALPAEEYEHLVPHLEVVTLPAKKILWQPGDRLNYVYFSTGAIISLVSVMESGATVEVGMVGREGVAGAPELIGTSVTTHQAIVQLAGTALRISADLLKVELNRCKTLKTKLLLYIQALFVQVAQGAVCNRLHTIEQRLARWLLTIQDGIEADEFYLTQEFIAEMIGIRRSSVTVAAGTLQQAGMIQYTRGRITILDRDNMQTACCECYQVIKHEFNRILDR